MPVRAMPKKLPCVGQVIGASDHDQVPFSDLVLNRVVEIRKRRVVERHDLFMPLTTERPIRRIGVVDVVGSEEYIYRGQVPFCIQDLLDPTTTRALFVCVDIALPSSCNRPNRSKLDQFFVVP